MRNAFRCLAFEQGANEHHKAVEYGCSSWHRREKQSRAGVCERQDSYRMCD